MKATTNAAETLRACWQTKKITKKAADYSHFELLSFLAIKSFVTLFFFLNFMQLCSLLFCLLWNKTSLRQVLVLPAESTVLVLDYLTLMHVLTGTVAAC